MFLRRTERRKNGKAHLYWSIVENKRLDCGRVVQRHVLYLGEINSSQAEAWRKAVEVFDADAGGCQTLALFADDRCEAVAADASVVRLRLAELRLHRPRQWAGGTLVAGPRPRSVLGRSLACEPEGNALGPHSPSLGHRSIDRAGKRVEAASRVVRPERHGRSARVGFRLGRGAQTLCLPRPVARPQGRAVLPSDGTLAGSVQRQFRRAALRSDEHL